jgi:hypothetical protein
VDAGNVRGSGGRKLRGELVQTARLNKALEKGMRGVLFYETPAQGIYEK